MQSKERNSAVEILRIVSMLFVVLAHFNLHGISPGVIACSGDLTLESTFSHLVESFAIVAVNVFVLISGYFGIRFKLYGVLRLFLICFCWGIISYLLFCLVGNRSIGKSIFSRLFAFTHDHWWFVIAYLYLYFAAPLLNAAIDHLDKKSFVFVILLFTFSTLYFGYIRNVGDYNAGYSFTQFVYLYLIGRFIHKYVPIEKSSSYRTKLLSLWLLCSGVTFSLALINQIWFHSRIPFLQPYPYNSPFVIGASVCLLCFALSFSFSNKTVNCISASVLPAYLLQDSMYWGYQWLYPSVAIFLNAFSISIKFILLFVISLLFLFLVILVDILLRKVVYIPILNLYKRFILPHESIAYTRLLGFVERIIGTV